MGDYTVTGSVAVAGRGLWRTAQVIGLMAVAALIVGLFALPDATLTALWYVAIPLLPASFLISPALWRNVCPLATLNTLSNGLGGGRVLTGKLIPAAGATGIVLLVVLVPARRFLFNANGAALAAVIVLVAGAACLLGAFFDLKAGFCNALCPILPVERLYGQRPLAAINNPRCLPCTMCTTKACIDLAPSKSIAQTLGRARRSHAWLLTGYGAFAAAFPGFVFGYYSTQDVPVAAAGTIYLTIAVWMGASYVLTSAAVRMLRVSAALAMVSLAGVAVGLYYWYAAPLMASALGVSDAGTIAIRGAAFALIAVWLWRGVRVNGRE